MAITGKPPGSAPGTACQWRPPSVLCSRAPLHEAAPALGEAQVEVPAQPPAALKYRESRPFACVSTTPHRRPPSEVASST
jgi:hypothetical protein